MTDAVVDQKAADLATVLGKLAEAADILERYIADPRVASCARELEGCDLGWSPPDPSEDDYLYDRVIDLFVEAGGDPKGLQR